MSQTMCTSAIVHNILPGFNLTVLVATSDHLAETLVMELSTPGRNQIVFTSKHYIST